MITRGLLIVGLGLNCPTWIAFCANANGALQEPDGQPGPMSSDSGGIGLATSAGPLASMKTVSGGISLVRIKSSFDYCAVELIELPQRLSNCQTLQAQHVLLRI